MHCEQACAISLGLRKSKEREFGSLLWWSGVTIFNSSSPFTLPCLIAFPPDDGDGDDSRRNR